MSYFSLFPFSSTKKNLLYRQSLQNAKSIFAFTVGDIISLSFNHNARIKGKIIDVYNINETVLYIMEVDD